MSMSSNVFNEKQIRSELSKLSNGSEKALEKLYKLLGHRIYLRLCRLLKSEVIAEEILQDVFLIIWNNRSKLNLEKSFSSYIFCIATNKCYDYFRTIKRNKKLLMDHYLLSNYTETIEEKVADKGNYEMLNDAIELLPPKRKIIFKLCKIECKSYEQISLQLGVSFSTISDHIVKANRFIKNYFENEGNYVILL